MSTTPIAVDSSGDSYVCVMETGIDSSAWVTLKFGRRGGLLWRKVWSPASAGQPRVFPSDLAIDPQGDVYETGALYTWNGATNFQQCATVKYSAAGKRQWIKLFAVAGDDKNRGNAICFAGGHAYVAGQGGMFAGSHHLDAFAIGYAPDGTLDWSRVWAPPGGASASFQDVVADGSGNAYACGSVADGAGGSDGAVVGFDASGAVSWATPVDIGDHDAYVAITRAASGALVTTGTADDMIAITRLLPDTGAIDFSVSWKGPASEIDRGLAVATSAGGDIYVAGQAKPHAKHRQALLLKY